MTLSPSIVQRMSVFPRFSSGMAGQSVATDSVVRGLSRVSIDSTLRELKQMILGRLPHRPVVERALSSLILDSQRQSHIVGAQTAMLLGVLSDNIWLHADDELEDIVLHLDRSRAQSDWAAVLMEHTALELINESDECEDVSMRTTVDGQIMDVVARFPEGPVYAELKISRGHASKRGRAQHRRLIDIASKRGAILLYIQGFTGSSGGYPSLVDLEGACMVPGLGLYNRLKDLADKKSVTQLPTPPLGELDVLSRNIRSGLRLGNAAKKVVVQEVLSWIKAQDGNNRLCVISEHVDEFVAACNSALLQGGKLRVLPVLDSLIVR